VAIFRSRFLKKKNMRKQAKEPAKSKSHKPRTLCRHFTILATVKTTYVSIHVRGRRVARFAKKWAGQGRAGRRHSMTGVQLRLRRDALADRTTTSSRRNRYRNRVFNTAFVRNRFARRQRPWFTSVDKRTN